MGAAASPWPPYWSLVLLYLLLFLKPLPTTAINVTGAPPRAPFHSTFPASAPLASLWTTNGTARVTYADGSWLAPILVQGISGPSFACGFFLCPRCDASLFAVLLVLIDASSKVDNTSTPVVLWAANRNHPISGFAALNLTAGGDLQLLDKSGLVVWSTNTSGAGVVAMKLTKAGSLTLVDGRNRIRWQSFDHPTDTALPGQYLGGKKLVANYSANSSSEGVFYLSVTDDSFSAFLSVNGTPQHYSYTDLEDEKGILLPSRLSKRFMRFEVDGHLRTYLWQDDERSWIVDQKQSTFDIPWGECGIPTACNAYGVCTDGECSCPDESHFALVDPRKPKKGCRELMPLSCHAPEQRQQLIPHENIFYFGYLDAADIGGTDMETCKEACRKNCDCRIAFFRYSTDASRGDCYLRSIVLSLIQSNPESSKYNSTAFIKVMIAPDDDGRGTTVPPNRKLVAGAAVGSFCFLVLLGVCIGFVWNKMRINYEKQDKVEYEDHEMEFTHLPGMPARFSYEELRSATDNFSSKLGEGGFGAVFQGTLSNGTRVAVKILGYKGQGIKEFLAEVETIGSVHHVNLVRLVGYCAERLHRLLVYEFLSNGSLEKWIFADNKEQLQNPALDWETKHKIILHVARGLSYLHEDCRHRIIHLDIKPQNILLDENFNAKVSDFGLSKLVDKDQSQVVTTLRGTPGYLAPEWLHSVITEKVDVYSFGVVVLETVSGKRILDHTRSPGSIHLVSLLKKAAEEDKLADVIGMECSSEEAMRMLRIAMWCLQVDYLKRPSMSVVVKVLQGLVDVSLELDHNFWVPVKEIVGEEAYGSSSTPFPSSFPSGPR